MFKKRTTSKVTENENTNAGNENDIKSLGQLIKGDMLRVFWLILYILIIGFLVYIIYSTLPFLFSNMYVSIGTLIGMSYQSATNADLLYWAMICLSIGAIVVAFIIILLYKLFKFITKKIVVAHVMRKE